MINQIEANFREKVKVDFKSLYFSFIGLTVFVIFLFFIITLSKVKTIIESLKISQKIIKNVFFNNEEIKRMMIRKDPNVDLQLQSGIEMGVASILKLFKKGREIDQILLLTTNTKAGLHIMTDNIVSRESDKNSVLSTIYRKEKVCS